MRKRRNKTLGVEINQHYYFNGEEVVVVNFGTMKIGEEVVDTIGYELVNGNGLVHNVTRIDFQNNLIPVRLRAGDVVYAVSMGKVLGTYKISSVDYIQATAKLIGEKIIFNVGVANNGNIVPICFGGENVEYYFLTNSKAKEFACDKRVNDCISCLNDVRQLFIEANLKSVTYRSLTDLYEKCMNLRVEATKVLKK